MSALDPGTEAQAGTLRRPEADEAPPGDAHRTADGPELSMRGAELSAEETAAVVTVISALAGAKSGEHDDAGQTGPRDRRLQRRRSLTFSRIGLWGRPGTDSWKNAGGLR
ncbi:hypothetical protein [Nesterenkonia populi]